MTEDDIRTILTDTRKVQALADALGVSYSVIRNIRRGKKYADVVAKIKRETV